MQLDVLFGSQTGNAQLAAQALSARLALAFPSLRLVCRPLNDFPFEQLVERPLLLFLVSTTGFGAFPANATAFWNRLTLPLPPDCLEDLQCAVLGFGDSSYQQFNFAARLLTQRLQQLGARLLVPLALSDENAEEPSGPTLQAWEDQVVAFLSQRWAASPLPSPFPAYTVSSLPQPSAPLPSQPPHAPSALHSAEVLSLEQLTSPQSLSQAFLLTLSAPSLPHFRPGDCASILHCNSPEQVQRMLACVEEGDATVVLDCHPTVHRFHQKLPVGVPVSVRALLSDWVDFQKPLSFARFKSLASLCSQDLYAQKIAEMSREDFHEYAVRERRTLWEILFDFHISRVSLAWLLNACPTLRPREFSIASPATRLPRLQFLFSLVDFKTPFGSGFSRACSRSGHLLPALPPAR